MPTTHYSQAALECRREKAEHVLAFPGLLRSWVEAAGKRVERVVKHADVCLVVFDDGCSLVARSGPDRADDLLAVLQAARGALEPHQAAAYAELDRLAAAEREAMRLARMEKVLGAVETNLPQVPELREELKRLLGDA